MHILIIPRIKDNEIILDSSLYNKKNPHINDAGTW